MCSPLTDISSTTFASGETNQTTTCLTATQESQHTKGSQQSCELSTNAQKEETTTITRPDPQITSYASYLKGVYIRATPPNIGHTSHDVNLSS